METSDLPITEELDEISPWPDTPPVNFVEQDVDIEAFELWQKASRMDGAADEEGEAK